MNSLVIPEEYRIKVAENLRECYHSLGHSDIEEGITARLRGRRARHLIEILDRHVHASSLDILDVGCGWGEMLLALRDWPKAKRVAGIEPGRRLYEISRLVHSDVENAPAESIPMPDGCFDLVIANDVLEHVDDLGRCLAEIVRVTKRGGFFYCVFPNYDYPAEAHYKIWIPPWSSRIPKSLVAWYLARVAKRDPRFWNLYVRPISAAGFLKVFSRVAGLGGRHPGIVDLSDYNRYRMLYGPINARYLIRLD